MRRFKYEAIDVLGKQKKGVIKADTSTEAMLRLNRMTEIVSFIDAGEIFEPDFVKRANKALGKVDSVNFKEFGGVLNRLARLLNSKLSLQASLEQMTVYGSTTSREIPKRLLAWVREGHDLASAFSLEKKYFKKDYSFVIKTGSESGTLPETLERLASELAENLILQKDIKSTLAYPKFVIIGALGIMLALFWFVLPQMLGTLSEVTGGEVPMITQIVMKCTDFVQEYGILLLIGIIGTWLLTKWLVKNKIRYQVDMIALRIPVMGEIVKNRDIIRLFRSLSNLGFAGVPAANSLESCLGAIENLRIQKELTVAYNKLAFDGIGLVQALKQCSSITDLDLQILDIGMQTGELSEMLSARADELSKENQDAIKALKKMIEPISMVAVGFIVLILVASIYLPMFTMMA